MNWTAHRVKHEAVTPEGYRITWTDHPTRGAYFNGWSPEGKHLEGSHDKEKVKTACEQALAKVSS